MHCSSCRQALERLTPFCPDCGATQSSPRGAYEPLNTGTSPVLRLAPGYVRELALRSQLPVFLFLVVWGALVLGGLVASGGLLAGRDLGWGPFAFAAAPLAFVVPLAGLRFEERARAATVFAFHPHRLDLVDGMLGRARHSLSLERLRTARLERGFHQARFGLGSIVLELDRADPVLGRWLRIEDVTDPDEGIRRVQALLANRVEDPVPLEQAA